MYPKNFFDLVCQMLPDDVRPDELLAIGKPSWWEEKPRLAAAYALRKCERLNWEAYLENNPDVKVARMDPVLHFLTNGVFESRKLYSWHPVHRRKSASRRHHPKVSVIVYNRDNALWLEKCLANLSAQTMKNLEAIVIDDASSDESSKIIKDKALSDSRFKPIYLENPRGKHNCRKQALETATGDYVMFVDTPDFLAPNACELAWKAISKGYDVVAFNVAAVPLGHLTPENKKAIERITRATPVGLNAGESLLRKAYMQKTLPCNLTCKIFERDLIMDAFSKTSDGDFPTAEDVYEFLPVANTARTLFKITDAIYNVVDLPGEDQIHIDSLQLDIKSRACKALASIEEYCTTYGLDSFYPAVRKMIFDIYTARIADIDSGHIEEFYNKLRLYFDDLEIVQNISTQYYNKWDEISIPFQQYPHGERPAGKISKIGLFHSRLTTGGIESTIQNLGRQLEKQGYELTLFVEEKSEADIALPPSIKIYYLTPSYKNAPATRLHLRDLRNAVLESGVQIMLMMIVHRPGLLWQTMLLRFMGIPVISSMRTNHNWDLLERGRKYKLRSLINTARCLDKLFCLSSSTQLYLRAHGIDAEYIPNPIRRYENPVPDGLREDNILVLCRLSGHPKLIGDSLLVLKEVTAEKPGAKMIFVGDFDLPAHEKLFFEKVKKLRLEQNVRVTGWVSNPAAYIDSCKLLFSSSALEGFPNGISEAQARGLPVVLYDIDIMIAKGNESVIAVPQNDIKAAAREICRLLNDEEERQSLSRLAAINSEKFNAERFATELIELIENYHSYSKIPAHTEADYRTVIRYMSFYAGKTLDSLTFDKNVAKV